MTFSNSGNFYHGFVNIGLSVNWHTDITTLPASNAADFYSTFLHEIVHSLGFMSLISSTGISIFNNTAAGVNNNYYSRYDKFLTDNSGNYLLAPSNTNCPTSGLSYTAPITAINPNYPCTPSFPSPDISTCSLTARYASPTQTIALYTPDCFENASSLSHFEDMCSTSFFSPPNGTSCTPVPAFSAGFNNLYYAMANSSSTGMCYTKRHLRDEERQVLCDIGYSVASTYSSPSIGSSAIIRIVPPAIPFNSFAYTNTCSPVTIIGSNDGLAGGIFIYTTTSNSFSISTASILANDLPASGLTVECEEVVYTNTVTNAAAAVSGTSLIVTAAAGSGLVLVKYLPKNSSGEYGTATYVYVYFVSPNCNPGNACNMIQNNGFENLINGTITPQCGLLVTDMIPTAISCWENYEGTPGVFSNGCGSSGGNYQLGNNTIGSSPLIINSFNGSGNNRVIGLSYTHPNTGTQAMKNNLSTPLVNGTTYLLSFLVYNPASTVNVGSSPIVISVASNTSFTSPAPGAFPFGLLSLVDFTVPTASAWSLITHTFTFLSSINHNAFIIGINPGLTSLTPSTSIWTYIDDLTLIALPGASLSPTSLTICGNQVLPNLNALASQPGVWSGYGVVQNGAGYDFNPGVALSPGLYPVVYTYTYGGCTGSSNFLFTVNTNTNYPFLSPPQNVCLSTPSLNFNSLLSNTVYIGSGSFYLNSSTVSPAHTFTAAGNNILHYIYTGTLSSLCVNTSNSITVNVYSVPSVPSIFNGTASINTTDLCIGNAFTVSATSSGSVVTWQPGGSNTYSQSFSPTVTTVYTLTAFNHSSCVSANTLAINVFTNCCNAVIIPSFTNNSISGYHTQSGPLFISSDVTVHTGGDFLLTAEARMAANVKIIVENGGRIQIAGAHLLACETDMWQGIVIKDGGKIITYDSNGKDNLIEDAIIAIDASNQATTAASPVIQALNTTFNKNYIDINISGYSKTITPYPFVIKNCVFTCRNLPFTSSYWPQTGSVNAASTPSADLRFVNSAATPTTGLAPPYLNQSNFTVTPLKNPYSGNYSKIAIQISTVGVNSGTTMYGITLGDNTSAADFNLFDAHEIFISNLNSNVTSRNNVFQNTIANPFLNSTGIAIAHNVSGVMNTSLDLSSSDFETGNRFWNCHRALKTNNLYKFNLQHAIFRSTQSTTNPASGPVTSAVNINTNRFYHFMRYNEFTNISNCINIGITAGSYTTVGGGSAYGTYAALIVVKENTISASPAANEYVNNAITISSPLTNNLNWTNAPNYNISPSIIGIMIQDNSISNVYRGLHLNGNGSNFPSVIEDNVISLEDDNIFGAPQYAVRVTNTYGKNVVTDNLASALSTTNTSQALYYFADNSGVASPSISCNTASTSNRGFEFNSVNYNGPAAIVGTYWRGNTMGNLEKGMVLSGSGIIGAQGTSVSAIDNAWQGTWSGSNYNLFTDGAATQATNSPLYLKTGSPWTPSNNWGNPNNQSYFSNGLFAGIGDYNCGDYPTSIVQENPGDVDYGNTATFYMARSHFYRMVANNPEVMELLSENALGLYTALQDSSVGFFYALENALYSGDFITVYSMISSVEAPNGLESNYLSYYTLYMTYAQNGFEAGSGTDSTSLLTLASLCPADHGAIIYQARALYNTIFKNSYLFYDNCEGLEEKRNYNKDNITLPRTEDFRIFPNPAKDKLTIFVPKGNENLNITIHDISNRVVLNKNINTKDFIINLDIELVNGIYLIVISRSANEKITKKIIIAK